MIFKFILIGLGMVVGDLLMKSWSNHEYSLRGISLYIYIAALCAYAASLTYYGKQLHVTNFSIATTLPIIINIIVVAFITTYFYNEPLSLYAIIGTSLAILSILFFYFA